MVVMLAGCTTVPETGRRQLNLMPPAEEMQLGLTSFEKVKQETPINRDPAINALVQKVGQRIATGSPDSVIPRKHAASAEQKMSSISLS